MKKIKSIRHLQNEKIRLREEQEALEKKIRGHWKELKESLHPSAIAKEGISKIMTDRTADNMTEGSILKNTFTYGVSLLAKKIADKATGKFEKMFKK